MPNDLKLQEGHPIDENLRPIKVGGESSALEISKDDVRVKNLFVSGDTTGVSASDDTKLPLAGGAMTGNITSASDFSLAVSGDITLDSADDIIIDSQDGNFIYKKNGTEFSPANSAYAGMILGFTEVFDDNISGEDIFQVTTTSFVNLSLTQGGGEKYLKVVFVVPPSNKVLIKVNLPYCGAIDGGLYLGLATDTSATTLHEDYERIVWDVDESDSVNVNAQWVIHGSDHSWSAGESKTLYAMVREGTAGGRIWSGDSLNNYGAWTMEAVALPATIGDGS
tara:strand:+ start:2789 stop:3628 length:840 start_codon:yes stop_codon:yes gene_type:complete